MFLNLTRSFLFVAAFCFVLGQGSTAWGQGGVDPGTVNQGGGTNQGGQTESNVQLGDGQFDSEQDNVDIEISDDVRNQGFIGATAPGTTFIGSTSENSGPPLADGASFGGGVNDFQPTIPGAAGQGGGGGPGGTDTSVTIIRKSLRARLRPNFYAPTISGQTISNRFQTHFVRQPGSRLAGQGYTIRVENRTAYLDGSVNSAADSQRLERQLRLEPGVYKIVNQLSINQSPVNQTAPRQFQSFNQAPVVQPEMIMAPQPVIQNGFQSPTIIQ